MHKSTNARSVRAATLDSVFFVHRVFGRNGLSQVQRLQGIHCVREALRAKRRRFSELRVRPGRRGKGLVEIVQLAETLQVPVREAATTSGRGDEAGHDQGVELEAGPLPEYGLEAILGNSPRGGFRRWLALDGVEDPQNVGAIVRVAEGAGADGLVMTQRRAPPLSADSALGLWSLSFFFHERDALFELPPAPLVP